MAALRRSTRALLLGALLLCAAGPRIGWAWIDARRGRVDERFTLRNLQRAVEEGRISRPDSAYYPGLSWLPVAAVCEGSEALAALAGDERLRCFRDGRPAPAAYRLGRSSSALYGVLGILVLYLVGRALFDPAIGLLAALLLAASPLHLYLSGLLKPDALLLLTTLVAVWLALRAADRPSLRRFAVAGAGVGLALSAKYNGGPVALALGTLGVLLLRERRWNAIGWLAAAAGIALLTFVALNPWILTAPELLDRAASVHAAQYRRHGETASGGSEWAQLPFFAQLVTDPYGHGPIVGALGLAALPLFAWRLRRRDLSLLQWRGLVMVLCWILGYGLAYSLLSRGNLIPRNWLVLLPWTSLGAAWLLVAGWRALGRRFAVVRGAAATAVAAAALVLAVTLPAAAFAYRMLVPSTLEAATRWVEKQIRPLGARTVIAELEGATWSSSNAWEAAAVLNVSDLARSPVDLDAADAELFAASRLQGPSAAFYRERMERVREAAVLTVRPPALRRGEPALIAIVHPWRRSGEAVAGSFAAADGDRHAWSARLPRELRGRIVSIEVAVPRRSPGQLEVSLQLASREARCVPLPVRGPSDRPFRCLRAHAPASGELSLHIRGLRNPPRTLVYRAQAWLPSPALRRQQPGQPQPPSLASRGAER